MLVLTRTADWYPDDANPAVRYRLPASLRPLPDTDGIPQAVVSRSPDGGLLHLRLGAVWPELASAERPVSFDAGRFRLLLQTTASGETGQWRPTPIVGDAVVERSLSLSPVEVAIARHLGARTGDLVDVEVELSIRGLAPTFPWLASVTSEALRPRIEALLGPAPATWEVVESAFLGLAEDTFAWYPLKAGAIRPPIDQALRAIAHHLASTLLTSTPAGWVMAGDLPARLDVSLDVARVEKQWVGLRWSFSEFLASQADPGRHLVDIAVPVPFAAAEVSVVNDLPLAPAGIRSIAIEIRTGGPTGLVPHEFLPGQPAAVRLRFVRETFEDLQLQWSARCTMMTAGGPAVTTTGFRPSGQLIELNAATLKLVALRFAAESEVFDHVASLEITIGTRTLTLTRASREAWAVGRQPPAAATVTAVLPEGGRQSLGAMSIGPLGMIVDAAALGIGETARVVVRPPADLERRAAYLAVQVEGHPWRTLDPGAEVTVPIRRENRFQPPRLRYRTRQVAREAGAATKVMAESAWRDGLGEVVVVDL
jgi:hypothetical protein